MAFQVLPNIVAQPKPIVRWQYAAATVLFGLTLLSATQLGLLANVSKLPKVISATSQRCRRIVAVPTVLSVHSEPFH